MRFLFLCVFLMPVSVSAVLLSVSTNIMGVANDSGAVDWGLAANFKVDKDLRFEIGYISHQTEKENQSIDYISTGATNLTDVTADTTAGISAGFVSLYYDTKPEEKFAPFIGLGVGFGTVEYTLENIEHTGAVTFSTVEKSETNLIAKLSIGMRYTFNTNFESFMQYDTFKSDFIDEVKSKGILSDSQLNIGLRMRF